MQVKTDVDGQFDAPNTRIQGRPSKQQLPNFDETDRSSCTKRAMPRQAEAVTLCQTVTSLAVAVATNTHIHKADRSSDARQKVTISAEEVKTDKPLQASH
jgi:hypothetical protein